ncbi:MAG: ABC transporter permease [Candidatus Cloacimonetes bacterium]|jgi:ABC-2 type transport system permease protein|nr:ABC transporter permease [Candidatus Cloacimonadota bacterium]MDY0298411.1 ABC transporter permease [Candidatus Cloacimonadaceae bacterium]MCB5278207.1 ABC transporter permease [Candidatus Cloacimonadota bacterium]MCK9331772.1 ABC transporter permease [Candidatus Cloacimonadota bacterium]MDD2209848.1 ABC transporter permease [Candidatus Cloacimonadota bacterium]
MRVIWIIAKKEYQLAMRSITSYIIFVLFLILSGSAFATTVFKIGLAELRGLYNIQHILFVFFIPAITMGSIAKERSSGTIEIFSTLPIRLYHIVWGKILASALQLLTLLIFNIIPFFVIALLGQNVDYGAIGLGFFGIFLAGCAYISIGIYASSIPSNQVLAFVLAFLVSGFFFIIRYLLGFIPLSIVRYFQYFSFDHHLTNMMKGVLDIRDLLFFVAVIFIFAILAEFNLQSKNLMQER